MLVTHSDAESSSEIFPFITRWEIVHDKWTQVRFPLNNGSYRDIPRDARLHQSLIYRLKELAAYSPRNNHGDKLEPCLKSMEGLPAPFVKADEVREAQEPDPMHQIWTFERH
jgi:hypothetical protein